MNKAISRVSNIPIETRGVLKPRGHVNDVGRRVDRIWRIHMRKHGRQSNDGSHVIFFLNRWVILEATYVNT